MAFTSDDISINTLIGPGSFVSGDIKINGFIVSANGVAKHENEEPCT